MNKEEGVTRRFPRGKRGLKSVIRFFGRSDQRSLPPREAWIEIFMPEHRLEEHEVASLAGGVD